MFGMCFKIGVRIVLFEIWVILATTKKIEYYSLRINDSVFIIGNHDLKKRNMKGEEALNLLRSHKFYASTTFFDHKNYTTWKSFDGLNKSFQLDHRITNSLNIIKDAKVIDYGVPSDHSAIVLILKFPKKKRGKKTYN